MSSHYSFTDSVGIGAKVDLSACGTTKCWQLHSFPLRLGVYLICHAEKKCENLFITEFEVFSVVRPLPFSCHCLLRKDIGIIISKNELFFLFSERLDLSILVFCL